MKTKYLITATVCSVLCMAGAQDARAQRVYKQGSAVVMDFGPGSGFPQTSVESTQGKKVVANYYNTVGPVTGNSLDDYDDKAIIDKTIYKKLEVATQDGVSGKITWADAYKACIDKGSNWRLPTHREIMQMWIFRDALVDLGAAPFRPTTIYWSATEKSATAAAGLLTGQIGSQFQIAMIQKGATIINTAITGYTVRCVRELP